MEKSKKYYELQALDLWDFPSLIRKAREIQGITLEALCKDLCSFSMMGKIERGERLAGKELRDRILARLGVCSDGYENFLFYEDYLVWKRQQRIVNAIEKSDFETAEKELAIYEKKKGDYNLEKQFCLVMRAQIMQKCHEDPAAIAKMYEEAVKLTVSDIEQVSIKDLCLSVQELDMILEYERCCRPECLASRCEEILAYISSEMFDTYSYVKIYPKVIYYLYLSTADQDRDWNCLLRLSNKGIEQLRTTGRMYYLWELIEIRRESLTWLLDQIENDEAGRKRKAVQKVIDRMTEWLDALDFVHGLCGTHRKMETSCYLYQQKEAYCISDVIRRRREMLGMTKKELCDGICSEKTIGRLEANKTKPQIEIVRLLFEKLNLSGEYQRAQIVSKDVKASIIAGEIGVYANRCDYKKVEVLLTELEQYISLENPINRQYKEWMEIRIKSNSGRMPKEEAIQCFRKILEATISYEAVLKDGEKYLTNVEMQCLLNIAMCIGKSKENKALDVLLELCRQLGEDEGILEHIAAWEAIMSNVANICGDKGEYDKSDAIIINTMPECIHCYRMRLLDMHLYINAWNNNERKKKNIPIKQGYQVDMYLKKCISLCQINKNDAREIVMKDQLAKLLSEQV
ncbi:MAG: helix-turn-helix domain-containing protein [Lachnospiraceae bacterium]|nr:helix-turn-helix domain-containing protein [Lachnospiraceae bacterium]MDE7205332.1 helix-turn-helix domain-containing protein [Lachnospiraceae bacterium]